MFKRRVPLSFFQQIRESVWPSIGWKRAARYTYLRVMRTSDNTQKLAVALAIGASVAFTPVIGTHFIQAGVLSWLFRCNVIAAMAATWIANPWTIPFMWWASIELGAWIFSFFGVEAEKSIPHDITFSMLWDLLRHDPIRVVLPWLTGGYTMALLVSLPAYFLFYYLLRGTRTHELKEHDEEVHHDHRHG